MSSFKIADSSIFNSIYVLDWNQMQDTFFLNTNKERNQWLTMSSGPG